MNFFKETPRIPFVKLRKVLFGFSVFLIVASCLLLVTKGLNFGTDFLGGLSLQYQFPQDISESEIRDTLQELNLNDLSVVRFGKAEERRWLIKSSLPDEAEVSIAAKITPKLSSLFKEGAPVLEMEQSVGPKVGQELRQKGILAVLFCLFSMLIYIGFRFDFHFAPGALFALFHDVLLILGIFALFNIEFNLTTLAACLTIVGYSINDSIVVFDRVREHARMINLSTLHEVVNNSINETLSRTLITGITTLFVTGILYFFGGETIKGFALALIIGILTGTFSTFSIACPAFVWFYQLKPPAQK